MTSFPGVTILTPVTHDRLQFIDLMISNVTNQTYPHRLIEWLVIGDSFGETREKFEAAFLTIPDIECKYIECDIVGDIGKKRNFSSSKASYEIMANMDSDDIYNKHYLACSIKELRERRVGLVGCRDMIIFFPSDEKKLIYIYGSSIHDGTMVYTRKHWRTFKYNKGMKAEGAGLVKGKFFNEMDIRKVMICVAHSGNTFSKKCFLEKTSEIEITEEQKNSMIKMLPMAFS